MGTSVAPRSTFLDYVDDLLARLSPIMAVAYYRSIRDIVSAIDVDAVALAIEQHRGSVAVVAILNDRTIAAAFAPLQSAIRDIVARAGARFYRDTPVGPPDAVAIARVRFNALDPAVVSTIERFEAEALGEMATTIRGTISKAIAAGLRDGVNPRAIAVRVRSVIGLSPQQEQFVRNYQAELEKLASPQTRALLRSILENQGTPAALARKLTDGNTDRTVRSAILKDRALTPAEIEKGVARYQKNLKAHQAESTSRTLTLNAMRESQLLAWEQAIAAGKVDEGDLIETWFTNLDGRERDTHHEMHGKTKRFAALWYVRNAAPQRYPGEKEYGCRCRVWIAPRVRGASAA